MFFSAMSKSVLVTRISDSFFLGVVAVAFLTGGLPARAVNTPFSWNGATSNAWGANNNWTPVGSPDSDDSVTFSAGANRTIDLQANRAVNDVTFNGNLAYRLLNNQLTIGTGNITIGAGANHRISSGVVLGANGVWDIAANTLTVDGPISSGAGGPYGIDKRGAGTLIIGGSTTGTLRNLLLEGGAAEFDNVTYSLTSTSFDAYSAIYMGAGKLSVHHGSKLTGSAGANLVLQSGGAVGSSLVVDGPDTEIKTFGQVFLGASGTGANSVTLTNEAKITDISLWVNGFNGNASTLVRDASQVQSAGIAVGMLPGVTGTFTAQGRDTTVTTSFLGLGGYNSSQKGGMGTMTISDRASLAASGDLRFFSSTSTLAVDNATASVGYLVNDAGVVGSIKLRNLGSTPALTITSPVSSGLPGPFTFDGVISDNGGAGGILKQGPGEQIFTKQQTYTGGTRIEGGTLTLGTANTLAPTAPITAVGGTLNLGANLQQAGTVTFQGGTITGGATGTLAPTTLALQSGTLNVPTFVSSSVVKSTTGLMTVNSPLTATAINVNAGALVLNKGATAPVQLNGGGLELKGNLIGNLSGVGGASVALKGATIVSGTMSLMGSLEVGAFTLVNDSTQPMGVGSLAINGGTVVADTVQLVNSITGSGTIKAAVSAPATSTITATGTLTIGDAASADSLSNYQGAINVGGSFVNLLSSGASQLGASTTLAGGSLRSLSGITLPASRTVSGYGVVEGKFTNQGSVAASTVAGTAITFDGAVNGAGSFSGNVKFNGSYSPGNSPAAVSLAGDTTFGPNSRLDIELGGTTEGSGYDHLDIGGQLTMGGTLSVSLINGFQPAAGQSFDLLDFDAARLSGAFSAISLPTLARGLMWNASQMMTSGLVSVALAGDYNNDGSVDAADYTVYRDLLGSAGTGLAADGNANGLIDAGDFDVWRSHYGQVAGTSAGAATVPEANTAISAFAGIVMSIWGRRAARQSDRH